MAENPEVSLENMRKYMELEPPINTPITIVVSPNEPSETRAKFEAAGYRVIEGRLI